MSPSTSRMLPRNVPKRLNGGVLALVFASSLAVPAMGEAQRAVRRDDGSPVGGAPSGGGSSSDRGSSSGSGNGASRRDPSTSSAPTGSSSGRTATGSGGSTASSGDRSGASAAPSGTTTAATTSSNGDRSGRGSSDDVPTYSRPRGNQPATGTAVARRGAPPYGDGDDIDIYVPGGYYPWGYGGFGFGGYYGYYDPWYGYDAYYGGQPYYANIGDGSLRLKVKPREATVYADGYDVGRVDDFDGMFQRLHIEPGPHRIEIRADGYETLEFEVRLLPDKTTTYEGELKRLP